MRLSAQRARRVHLHRTYKLAEFAVVTGTCRGTVRNWIKRGMPAIAGKPTLIPGRLRRRPKPLRHIIP